MILAREVGDQRARSGGSRTIKQNKYNAISRLDRLGKFRLYIHGGKECVVDLSSSNRIKIIKLDGCSYTDIGK